MDKQDIIDLVRQHVTLKDRVDTTVSLQNDIKDKIREGIKELGEENDLGHIVVEIDDEVTGVKRAMQQRKVSKNLDMDVATEVLKEKGLYDRCVMMVPALDEQEIMAAYYENLITEEDIDKMFPARVSWALVIK
jgi:hypothetical protein